MEKVDFVGLKFLDREATTVFDSRSRVRFDRCQIDKPELFRFHNVVLRPSWFIDVDVRKVHFTDVKWYGLPNGPEGTLREEIDALREQGVDVPYGVASPHTLLAQACRRLSANAEESREYPLANEFHYWSMEAQRKKMPRYNISPWRLIWWYWALNGYGERHIRAAVWLIAILVGFAALYMWLGPVGAQKNSLIGILGVAWESIVYSLGVMTRLANDIPKSASTLVTSLIIIEGVIGPLQIGLFLLALRREFMR